MTPETIVKALGGRTVGSGWMAHCPAHDDRVPSLSICESNGKILLRCHAGCDQRHVIAVLEKLNLWEASTRPLRGRASPRKAPPSGRDQQRGVPSASALSVWQSTIPASGTPVGAYLAARGLSLPVPPSIRFHRGLKHPSGCFWPGMVALISSGIDGTPQAVHRTFLARDGSCQAPVAPVKMMLGPCRGGAVRLGESSDILMIGEGIETCLAAMQATGIPAWAALSTSGMRALDLPDGLRDVIVLADGDKPGAAAARHCGLRWVRRGLRVRIARAPRGLDFADMLLGGAAGKEACEL